MKTRNSILILVFFSNSLLASCVNILDVNALTKEQKTEIREMILSLQANRKLEGLDICFQIDFLDKLPDMTSGFSINGISLLRNNYYFNWMLTTNSNPSILILFVKDSEGTNFKFESLLVNGLLSQRIPPLVVRFIQNEIMKKKTTNFDIINAGIRAFIKALDNQYKDRLINDVYNNLTNPIPQELQPGYANYDFKYLYFESYRKEYPLSYLGGGAFAAPLLMNDENKVTSTTANTANIYDIAGDILKIGIENDKPLNVGKVSIRDVSRIMDFYQFEHDCILAGNSTYFQEGLHKRYFSNNSKAIEDITAWVNKLETEGSLDVYGAGIARARAKAINDNCFHFSRIGKDGNQRSSRMDFYDYKRNYHTRVDVGYGTVTKGEKISEQQGQLLFSDFRGNQPTWCNDFAIRASRIIFGFSPIGGTTKNMEPDMASDPGNFVNLTNEWASGTNNSLVWSYITNGFVVYFVNENDHIEIGYDIDQKGNSLYYRTIGGGATVGRKITSENSFLQDKINGAQTRGVSVFLYLGYLKN